MKPTLLRGLFAHDVLAWLDREGLTYAGAVLRHPMLNKAMLSRAKHCHILSIESYLALCLAASLNPMRYLDQEGNQAVTEIAQRETHVRAH